MKAIEFEQHNVVFAKDQKEYLPLPAHAQNNGLVTFCMELDDDELEAVKKTKILKVTVLTYGAGKANKAWEKDMAEHYGDPEPYGPEDIIEQGRSQIKKNQQAFGPLVYPVRFVKSLIRKRHGHH